MNTLNKPLALIMPETESLFGEVLLSGLCSDSRHVQQGDLFFALSGADFNGSDYVDQAIDKGAAAIAVEKSEQWANSEIYRGVPLIAIENLASKVSAFALEFYQFSASDLSVIGITGTNAKTSCSAYIQQLLQAQNQRCGVVGTLGWGVGENLMYTGNTTPSNLLLQRILSNFAQEKVPYAAIEVSSHGLELGRVENVQFKVALLTNISRDHLDFHGDMQSYVNAKKKLFQMRGLEHAVINIDDEQAQGFVDVLDDSINVLTYGFSDKADVQALNFSSSLQGMTADILYQSETYALQSSLLGDFNIYNLLASCAVMLSLGYGMESVIESMPLVSAVKGRMQTVENALGLTVIVDFAHTPDGLESVLKTLREHSEKTLWCVFGCGGDRDKGKRALMGEIAARYADKVVITSDNPRGELAQSIIDDIATACDGSDVIQIIDRKQAIDFSLQQAQAGDCIVIAGKGHEDYQEIAGVRSFFSDVLVAEEALTARQQGIAL